MKNDNWCRRVLDFSPRQALLKFAAILAIVGRQQAAGVPCNYCLSGAMETPIPPAQFGYLGPTITPFIKQAALNWCGIIGAPAVGNPSLVCTPNLKSMLLKRNFRATASIWCPQAWIVLRSGVGSGASPNFMTINDPDPTGMVGDALGDLVTDKNPITGINELARAWNAAQMQFGPSVKKGGIALSAGRMHTYGGTQIIGASVCKERTPSQTKPWLAAADPTLGCSLNERSFAHELGHILGLCHENVFIAFTPSSCDCPATTSALPGNNLMVAAGLGADLTLAQAKHARSVLAMNPVLDPPGVPGTSQSRVDVVFDASTNTAALPSYLDISKIVAVDSTFAGGDLSFYVALEGVIPASVTNLTYWILLDRDNSPGTGRSPMELVPGTPIDGIDLVLEVTRTNATDLAKVYSINSDGTLTTAVLAADSISASIETLSIVMCPADPTITIAPEPFATELEFRIANSALAALGIVPGAGGTLFTNGLRVQAVGSAPGTPELDFAPGDGQTIQFEPPYEPYLTLPPTLSLGDNASVTVQGIAASAPLELKLLDQDIPISVTTDNLGAATFSFAVPTNLPAGPALITVGIANATNASTAVNVVEIIDPAIPFRLEVTTGPSDFALSWSFVIAKLQEASSLSGPWTTITNASSPWTVSYNGNARFFQLQR